MNSVDFDNMRRAMVDSQLRTSGVTEAWVLAAMASIPREEFVPDGYRAVAYMDRSIPLGNGNVLNPPVATALMLQAAEIRESDDVLLIGDTGGYVKTLLAKRAGTVSAATDFDTLTADTYSVLFVDGAIEQLPDSLISAVREGGRVVTGLVDRGVTSLAHGVVRGGRVALRRFADSEVAPLPAFARKAEFVF